MDNANKPAFPINDENCSIRQREESSDFMQGLTKLEYFAGLALQGICAADIEDRGDPKWMAQVSVDLAVMLIAALEKELEKAQ
jgi:hypothetical protein